MQKSKNNAYNPKEKGPLFARSISQTGAFNYTRFFFPLTIKIDYHMVEDKLIMFEKAIVSEYMTKNPAKGATVIKGRQKERRVLTIDEQACFLQAAAGDWYEPLFYVALLTGLRQGELCALTWDDIDFEAKTLSVNKTLIYSKD